MPDDGTFAVFVSPVDNPEAEFQIDGEINSLAEARQIAESYVSECGADIEPKEVQIRSSRAARIPEFVSALSEREVEAVANTLLERTVPGTDARSLLSKATLVERVARSNSLPYLLCYAVFAIYSFSIAFTVPDWLPLFGEWMKGSHFTADRLARYFPYILMLSVTYVVARTVSHSLSFALLGDCVLVLVFKYKWNRDSFDRLYRQFLLTKQSAWTVALVKLLRSSVPNVGQDRSTLFWNHVRFDKEDFNSRMHSLEQLKRGNGYGSYLMPFSPVAFLLRNDRLRERVRLGTTRPYFPLPHHLTRRGSTMFRVAIVTRAAILLAAWLWSVILAPPDSVIGWIGTLVALCFGVGLPALWNYMTLIKRRGYPQGWGLPTDWRELERTVLVF